MPKKGFKSLTVAEEVYDKIYAKYEANKSEYKEKGVFSFAGYVTKVLLDSKEKDQLSNITEMLIINNSILIGMFDVMMGAGKEGAQDGLQDLKLLMMDFIKNFKEVSKI